MPPACTCGHPYTAHVDHDRQRWVPCYECDDLEFYGDITPMQACPGYYPCPAPAVAA